jgi:hypothetical protein
VHKGVEARIGLLLPLVSKVKIDHRGFELGVPQVTLDEPGIHARFEQMGGVGMAQSMDGDAHFGDPGSLFGFAEGALDTGATHRGSRRRTLGVIAPGGGKEPGRVAMGFPVSAEQGQCLFGQGNIPVFGALAAVDMDLETWAIDVGDLQEEGFVESESQAIDGGEVDLVVQGGSGRQEALDLLHTEHGGETVRDLRAHECEGVPIAFEDVLIEEANTTVADTHGGWGEAVDVFPVQDIALQLLFGDAVGGFVVELGQQADFSDIGCLRPFAFAAEVESRDHLLTQWAHVVSPFVRRVVDVRRKTS